MACADDLDEGAAEPVLLGWRPGSGHPSIATRGLPSGPLGPAVLVVGATPTLAGESFTTAVLDSDSLPRSTGALVGFLWRVVAPC
ncbi:hypothetical protein GCM10010193_16670 [Kitasatospora atroaurantiaca]